jgi:hypothetical protein
VGPPTQGLRKAILPEELRLLHRVCEEYMQDKERASYEFLHGFEDSNNLQGYVLIPHSVSRLQRKFLRG